MVHSDEDSICIVGAGQAGIELALGLRQQGVTSRITVIGEEQHAPYQRPPLSKACLKGIVTEQTLALRPPPVYEKLGIELMRGIRVEAIDLQARRLALSDGREIRYAKLGLTTGGRARALTLADGSSVERAFNFHTLRTIDDALKIRAGFLAGRRLVVIGGGYVGLEVAASAIASKLEVTVLEAQPRVLARVTAPQVSQFYERVHREAGVDLRTGVQVVGFEQSPTGSTITAVKCSDGSTIAADLVVAGVGLVPNTELAQAAGLEVDDGIVVDECARTSDPHTVAAGDCTRHPCVPFGRRVRLESVPNAIAQARSAAATLAGKPRAHDAVPWFWSDQYDLNLQIAGLSQGYDQTVLRGSLSGRAFSLFYLRDGAVIACDVVNRPQEFLVARKLIAERCRVDANLLSDERIALRSLDPSLRPDAAA